MIRWVFLNTGFCLRCFGKRTVSHDHPLFWGCETKPCPVCSVPAPEAKKRCAHAEYWEEAFTIAMDEVGLWSLVERMTPAQRYEIGESLQTSGECKDMSFYTPPPSDRYNAIEREWKEKYQRLEREMEAERRGAETAIRRAYRLYHDTQVSIDKDGSVYRHGGRTERIA